MLFGPVPAPLDEPLYDANGNIVEPLLLGVAAGAGDGRGMHSDHSQDSSGRGTSVSSSDVSSGLQSEVSVSNLLGFDVIIACLSYRFSVIRNKMKIFYISNF